MDIKSYIESGIIESYVLGLTTTAETAEVEAMANEHSEIKQAILDFEILLENQANTDLIQPDASVKTNLNKILFTPNLSEKNITSSLFNKVNTAAVHHINLSRYIAAAAIILLVISTCLNFYFYSGYKNSKQQFEALLSQQSTLQANNASYKQSLQMMEDSSMKHIEMKGTPGREQNLATVLWDKNSKDVYLYINNMQQTPAGKQYQLWAIVNGKPVDAGMINDCVGLCKMKKINHAEAFAITLEKEGGSPTPTMDEMYVMGKI